MAKKDKVEGSAEVNTLEGQAGSEVGGASGDAAAATTAAAKAETIITKVTMTDGREVEFKGKRKMLKTQVIDGAKVSVRIDFVNGQTRLYDLPEAQYAKAAAHGWSQKLGDEASNLKDIDDAVLAIDELADRVAKGEWNEVGGGDGMAGTSVLLKAMMELSGKTADETKAFLKGKTQAEKMALRGSALLKPIVEKLEAEKAAKGPKVDTGALLAGFMGTAPAA